MANTTADKLALAAANKVAIKAAIAAKNPTTAPTDVMSQWPTAIASIPSGGGGDPEVVRVWDDAVMTETVLVVDIKVPEFGFVPMRSWVFATGSSNVTIDFGDGTSPVVVTENDPRYNSDLDSCQHFYAHPGRYVVTISNDLRHLMIGGGYNGVNENTTRELNSALSIVKVCKIGNKVSSQTNSHSKANGFYNLYALSDLCALNPAMAGQEGPYNSAFYGCRSLVALPDVVSNNAISLRQFFGSQNNLLVSPKKIIVPNCTNVAYAVFGNTILRTLPEDIVFGAGVNVSYSNSKAVLKESVATFSDGELDGGLAYTITPADDDGGVRTLTLNATIKNNFSAEEQAKIAAAFNLKGWTLVW